MTIVLALSFFVMLAGLLIYLFAAPPKIQKIGEIMFFCGLLAGLIRFGGTFALSGH